MKRMEAMIGNTPMIRLRYRLEDSEREMFVKIESYNPTGSIKDRIAWYILKKAEERGQIRPGQPIVEMTSGNTGISLAAFGALCGYPVHIFMPDWASQERKSLMQMYGAHLHLVSKENGGFNGALEGARQLAEEIGAFQPKQFENRDNPDAHFQTTGAEILRQLPDVTDFVSGIGSGGTLMGIGRRLKADHDVKIAAVEPDLMPLLSGGQPRGEHHVEGIGDNFIPAIVDRNFIDEVYVVNDLDCILMAAKIGRVLGLGVGISSGANFLAAALHTKDNHQKVATVFADDNKKYLSTLLANPPAETDDMITPRIELLDYEVVHSR